MAVADEEYIQLSFNSVDKLNVTRLKLILINNNNTREIFCF